ncbi:MAG TPA: recombinase family protein [Candidatus Sulfotelmatobacter sp.]|jgi:putative DNA-invertase from lambdoid prophage Rac|nr:recombinase family protein [Candidatus Sulfotelmatobacter sp.]
MNDTQRQVAARITLGYVRTSTNRQDLSIEAQTERVRRAAEYHKTGDLRIFSAADTSGRLEFLKRSDETAELMETAREARASGVEVTLIVPKVDRLGRDSIDVSQTVRLFDELGVRVIFLDINVDTRTAMGRAFMQIAAVFAELEVATIRERIKTALDQKRSHGQLTGSVTFGWNAEPTGETTSGGKAVRRLLDNLAEQKWILHMVRRREAGWMDCQIARELNQLGVKSKRAGELIKVKCDPDTPGAQLSQRGHWFIIRPASGLWQAEQVTTLLGSTTVTEWLEARASN